MQGKIYVIFNFYTFITDDQGKLNRSNDSGSSVEGSTSLLPVAALTKEQLQQAIVYLMKVNSIYKIMV